MPVFHLGLSTSGHDPALAVVGPDGTILFAEATERVLQDKRAWGAPPDHLGHVRHALAASGFDAVHDELRVATTWRRTAAAKPSSRSDKSDLTTNAFLGASFLEAGGAAWLSVIHAGLQQGAGVALMRLGLTDSTPEPRRFDHHLCHAVAACAFAPVSDAACVVLDGAGEVGAVSTFALTDRTLSFRSRSWGPGSLGVLYAWITELCGFDWVAGEEWKVMGLAAYGTVQPDLRDTIARVLRINKGRLELADHTVLASAKSRLAVHARDPHDPVMTAADLAASGQAAFAQLADQVLAAAQIRDEPTPLILTGGCALNSAYNGTIANRLTFDPVFVPPAPGDDGNAIGAALLSWMEETGSTKIPQHDGSPYLGSQPNLQSVKGLNGSRLGCRVTDITGRGADAVADLLAAGRIIGVMRGRAEWGPRALGHRSILASPCAADMKDRINRDVKGREAYRPFAPVIRMDDISQWFERPQASPYMSMTLPWRADKRAQVPATVHEDGTGRLQTVTPKSAPWMHDVVSAVGERTGVPVVLNTSFNVMGKPIVHTVEDALAVFATSGLDAVILGDTLIEKAS
ncbi:carbamoyltransferase C-terminal domain-containing protein [uncultured Tateyamaria sp.]|uniref:carbamoyltransferase family protein n=1 Tax=uncultured Tateyamaria sp. TaxID=455651 RepID=UPI002635CB96|nr:carbamoyltransferase C-terminal domain-containing protein [uncultured Tateyamaria sp.]